MKRVLIIRNAMPYDFGGAERFAVDLATELQKHGWDPLVVSRSAKLLDYARQQHIDKQQGWWWQWQDWSGKRAVFFPLYIIWQCVLCCWYAQLILRSGARVVHPQSKDDFIAATIAARLLGRRVIWTDHADLKYIYENHRVWYKNPVGKLVYTSSRLAQFVTLVSKSEKQLIAASLGQTLDNKYRVIHNGVVDQSVIPAKRSAQSFIFCATSRLVVAKGIGEMITAFKNFVNKRPEAELWLVGDGPDDEMFHQQADGIAGIQFIGHSDSPLQYVAACDVFVHPSYHEGFSLSLIEATMLSKPIIACSVGGNPEIITDHETGLLVESRNAQVLAAAMEELYQHSDLAKKLGKNARASFEEQFQFDKIVSKKFVPLYEKISA